ncbi:MAG: hypothetical protein AUJ96_25230 [Armatimonadetes bacterium CG2_30_66_41]|nr:MAG: hypothetical protein AUJ96_25230 [Armatimonadetes bacterium CG2_30_66_41]
MSRWNDWGWFPPSVPKQAEGGIVARSQRGEFGTSWWAKKWIGALESFGWSNRLQRGRRYARSGQVLDFELAPGEVSAKVQGSRSKPYDVTIQVKPLTKAEWRKVTDLLAGKVAFAARLLAGEMPPDIEGAFQEARVSLLPGSANEIETDCSCPDWANPCKHIAAVHYLLGEELDRDPFLMFQLRGMEREELLAALRSKWLDGATEDAPPAAEESAPPLDPEPRAFWGDPSPLDGFRINVARPPVAAAVVKRLGEPPFWREDEGFGEVMERWYETVTARAIREAYADGG